MAAESRVVAAGAAGGGGELGCHGDSFSFTRRTLEVVVLVMDGCTAK